MTLKPIWRIKKLEEPKLCPFETVKRFKTGLSVKCPKTTSVIWTRKQYQDRILREHLTVKRKIACEKCIHSFALFLNTMGGLIVWQ